MELYRVFRDHPCGSKAKIHKQSKICDGALYTQAAAIEVMIIALMTILELQVTISKAQEYLRLRQVKELKKKSEEVGSEEQRKLRNVVELVNWEATN